MFASQLFYVVKSTAEEVAGWCVAMIATIKDQTNADWLVVVVLTHFTYLFGTDTVISSDAFKGAGTGDDPNRRDANIFIAFRPTV